MGHLFKPVQAAPARDLIRELGVRPIINAAGSYTMFTGNLMWPEAMQAYEAYSKHYFRLTDLQDAVGRRIAQLVGAEAAMVTSGAFGALMLGTAACITGKNPDFIRRIPDTEGMKNEVLVQKTHRFPYDHAVRNCGIRLIEVETRQELEKAINSRTAMMLFLNKADPLGQIQMAEFIAIGKQHGIPTFNDAAADVPPVENLTKYLAMGFDLVTFSGGKGIRGPQSAGLLMGRRDLIEAARLNTLPHSDTFGRGLKVNKEELVAMLIAVERYLQHDHAAEWKRWEQWAETIAGAARRAHPAIKADIHIPVIANAVPHVRIYWEKGALKRSPQQVLQALSEGEPPIELVPPPGEAEDLNVSTWTLQPGEAEIVARRLGEELSKAKA